MPAQYPNLSRATTMPPRYSATGRDASGFEEEDEIIDPGPPDAFSTGQGGDAGVRQVLGVGVTHAMMLDSRRAQRQAVTNRCCACVAIVLIVLAFGVALLFGVGVWAWETAPWQGTSPPPPGGPPPPAYPPLPPWVPWEHRARAWDDA